MDKPWKRKPRNEPNFKDHRIEDLFYCHTCKEYYPWFSFCKGKIFVFSGNDNDDNTYEYMNDIKDRGGYQWSCDICIDKILYNNKIITIRNNEGKIININM
jgi:hypothetical protein